MPRSLSALTWNMPPTACQSRCLQVRTDLNGILSMVCPSCAISMARQVLVRLESISTLPSTAKLDLGFSDSLIFSDELEYPTETLDSPWRTIFNGVESSFTAAYELVKQIDTGIKASAAIARQNKMDRAFAIAPTASCSYQI